VFDAFSHGLILTGSQIIAIHEISEGRATVILRCLVNAVTGKVGTSLDSSGYPKKTAAWFDLSDSPRAGLGRVLRRNTQSVHKVPLPAIFPKGRIGPHYCSTTNQKFRQTFSRLREHYRVYV